MKVAVLFSGQPRGIDVCLKGWKKHLFDKYDCDVYIHAWHDPSKEGQLYRTSRPEFTSRILENTVNILATEYNPKLMVVSKPKQFPTNGFHSTIQPNDPGFINAIQSMWYSRYLCGQLVGDWSEYDVVVTSRFDLLIKSDFNLENINNRILYTYHDCKHTDYCLNDHFAVAKPWIINRYCKLYPEIYRMYMEGIPWCSETFLGIWIKEIGIQSKHYPLQYRQLEYV